jgi:hypothetical protein
MVILFIKSEFLQKQKNCRFRRLTLQLGSNFLYSGKNSDFMNNNENFHSIKYDITLITMIVLRLACALALRVALQIGRV